MISPNNMFSRFSLRLLSSWWHKVSVQLLCWGLRLASPDGSEVFWVMIKLAPGFLVQMNEVHCRRKADNYYRQAKTPRQATTMPAIGGKLEGIWGIKTWSHALSSHPSNPTQCRDTEDFLFRDTTSKTIKLIIDRQGACNHCVTGTRLSPSPVSRLGVISPVSPSPRHAVTCDTSHITTRGRDIETFYGIQSKQQNQQDSKISDFAETRVSPYILISQ